MVSLLLASIIDSLQEFNIFGKLITIFQNLGAAINDGENMQFILLGALLIMLIVAVVTAIVSALSYERKLLRTVKKLNRFFARNPQITEENLIDVNNRMKNVPNTLRYCWQEYMINRDKMPSEYINSTICVDRPLKSSSFTANTVIVRFISIIFAIITFLIGSSKYYYLASWNKGEVTLPQDFAIWFEILLIPALVLLFGYILALVLKSYQPRTIRDIYDNFYELERYLNRACVTMPQVVEYEVLFTAKEIAKGIPALQAYQEKRAIQEQLEMEEAQINAAKFEDFNFDSLGLENSLLMERAMKESEKYFNVKRTLTEKVVSKQLEMNTYQSNFDKEIKEYDKKEQAIRENIGQLDEQLSNTTVRIEMNYIRKRKNEEQQKLQQIEKDREIATSRFNKQQEELETEIKALNDEIDKRKSAIEKAMISEGKSYANKVFGQITTAVMTQNEPIIHEMEDQKAQMEQTINDMNVTITDQQTEIDNKNTELDKLQNELNVKLAEIEAINNVRDYFNSSDFRDRVNDAKKNKFASLSNGGNALGDDVQASDEILQRAVYAENQLKLAQQRQKQLEVQESQLLEKLKALEEKNNAEQKLAVAEEKNKKVAEALAKAEKAESKYSMDSINRIKTQRKTAKEQLLELDNNIEMENKKYNISKIDLKKIVESVDVPKKEVTKEIKPNKNAEKKMRAMNLNALVNKVASNKKEKK